jgi:hypothetical protein
MHHSLCILCKIPNEIWIKFLNGFTEYTDIYVVVDDNEIDYVDMYKEYTRIKIIQVPNQACLDVGFKNLVSVTIHREITAWEKALYYFSFIKTDYKNVWFIEDDVFIYSESTLLKIDSKCTSEDLVTSSATIGVNNMPSWTWWEKFELNIPRPHYHCMCCVIRMSKRLVDEVKLYASKNGTLTFLESLFPTLCRFNEFPHGMPDELKYCLPPDAHFIVLKDIYSTDHLWHPVKDIESHKLFRSLL